MTLPRSVSDVLAEHVTLEVECIDWMYLNVYVPGLQFPELVIKPPGGLSGGFLDGGVALAGAGFGAFGAAGAGS